MAGDGKQGAAALAVPEAMAPHAGLQRRYRWWHRRTCVRDAATGDNFARLLGHAGWAMLHPAVRRRFSARLLPGACLAYLGEVTECRMNLAGWLLAQAARLIGAPLPLSRDTGLPACVSITADRRGRGQFWTRQYGRANGFPQVIHSSKRFAGPTGIEEYLGHGFGIALRLEARQGALFFISDHYFWRAFGMRLRCPDWLAPGRLTVGHIDCSESAAAGHGHFAFTLNLTHRLLGTMLHQVAIFADPQEEG